MFYLLLLVGGALIGGAVVRLWRVLRDLFEDDWLGPPDCPA